MQDPDRARRAANIGGTWAPHSNVSRLPDRLWRSGYTLPKSLLLPWAGLVTRPDRMGVHDGGLPMLDQGERPGP